MSAARLAARVAELLGPVSGGVMIAAAPALARALATRCAPVDGDVPAAAVVSFLGEPARPAVRQRTLAAVRARLVPGAPLVLLDHSQPRAAWRRIVGLVPLLATGLGPARARYPAARELAALGFAVERLRLACGERVQLVLVRRP